MEARKLAEGTALEAQAAKEASSGFFKKPQWELAASSYSKAAVCFKVAKAAEACAGAHVSASQAYLELGTTGVFQAAKHLEAAGALRHSPDLLEQAALLYRSNGTSP